MKRGALVAFMHRGHYTISPVLQVNLRTVRVVVSDGERLIAKDRLLPRIGPCRDPLALWFVEFYDGGLRRTYHANRDEARARLRLLRRTQ